MTSEPSRHAAATQRPDTGRKVWSGQISTLTLRILAVNLIALLVVISGVLFLDQYRNQLIERELATLESEARVFAAMVSEGAVAENAGSEVVLSPRLGRQMVRRLTETTKTRARLFSGEGELLADSHMLSGGLGMVEIEELSPLAESDPDEPRQGILRFPSSLSGIFGVPANVSRTDEDQSVTAASSVTVNRALLGDISTHAWIENSEQLQFTAAAPVQQFKQVLGAVLLIRDGRAISSAMIEVRRSILYISMIALSITVLLSLYLAGAIERPLRKLARAADQVRRSPGRTAQIPDFTARKDEIGDLSLSLREMTEALWQRLDAIEAFAADVSHELKNPLTSLRSAVETAARVSDPEQQRKLMSIIQDDVRRLDRLITDISNASRLDAELSRADSEPVDVRALLQMLIDTHRNTVQAEDPESPQLIMSLPGGGSLFVWGLESRLVQVFQNLIANAISFSPPKGLITVTAERRDNQIVVTVEDEGPGIPEGKLKAIFDRFYSERPRSEKFGTHSGLGLSISKQIVDAHQGTIEAENRYESMRIVGARFIVSLPALRREGGSRG